MIVSALDACKSLVNADNRAAALNTILSRLEGKARAAVGSNPQDVEEIIQKLKDKCKITIAPETVVAKLNATKQSGEVSKFTQDIEKLTLELERAYINEQVPVDTASRMAVKAGVKALASGIRSEETKLLLKAGQFTTLDSAIEKITENEPSSTSQIFHASAGNPGNNRYLKHGNRQSRNNSRGHFNSNSNSNVHSNFRGRGNYRGHGNFRGQYGSQRNYHHSFRGGNNFRGGNFRHQSRVFYAQQENMQAPQQLNVGGTTGMMGTTGMNVQPAQQSNQQVPLQSQQVALANIVRR